MTLLNDIPFTSPIAHEVRNILEAAGCKTDDDIVKLGCTGLIDALAKNPNLTFAGNAMPMATRVRENMDGSGCGLPCYVPATRFCLVHNTIGGLQQGQVQQHPEGVPRCSRELAEVESLHARAVQAVINQEGLKEAQARFGLEVVEVQEGVEPSLLPIAHPAIAQPKVKLDARFVCDLHSEIDWGCRFCLASAIVNGPLEPGAFIRVSSANGTEVFPITGLTKALQGELAAAPTRSVFVSVDVAVWEVGLVRKR